MILKFIRSLSIDTGIKHFYISEADFNNAVCEAYESGYERGLKDAALPIKDLQSKVMKEFDAHMTIEVEKKINEGYRDKFYIGDCGDIRSAQTPIAVYFEIPSYIISCLIKGRSKDYERIMFEAKEKVRWN